MYMTTREVKSQKRTDEHRPSVINPANYQIAEPMQGLPWWKSGPYIDNGTVGPTCDHCGHSLRYYVRFKHLPTNGSVIFGEECAELIDTSGRVAYEMKRLRKRAREGARKAKWAEEIRERNEAFKVSHPDLVEFIEDVDPQTETFPFVVAMVDAYEKWGNLTDRQIDALQRTIKAREEQAARQLYEAMHQPETQAPDGKVEVTGTVLSVKGQHSPFGGWTEKMLVKLNDGNKIYGTVPSSLLREVGAEDLKGKTVSFSATFSRKEDHFSWYARPTKAKVIT